MKHIWTKPEPVRAGRRPLVLVVDGDAAVRGAALRLLRNLDVAGVALPDVRSTMCWLRGSLLASIIFVDRPHVERLVDAVEEAYAKRTDPNGRPIVIALSTTGELHEHAEVMTEGADGLLVKPFDPATFLRSVSSLLQVAPRKRRVLLVDDDADIRDQFGLLLEDHGYDVVPAGNGKVAWEALEKGLAPDVILLDMMMPVMNGREIWERLRCSPQHKSTPIVVITAGRDNNLSAPILRKPIAMDDLLAAVAAAAPTR